MTSDQCVLVVNGLRETRDVLQAVLEPRGMRVDRVRGDHVPTPPDKPVPQVVVIDGDHQAKNDVSWSDVPRVMIGTAAKPKLAMEYDQQQYLQKPFQYSELIQAIDQLLDCQNRAA